MKYNLCFVINKNYIGQFIVSIVSLFENNKESFVVHLLNSDLNEEDEKLLTDIVKKYDCEIVFYKISDEIFSELPKMGYDAGYTAYYKVLIPYELSHLDNVLYLDCDLVVKGKITDIYEMNRNHVISAVIDLNINKNKKEHVLLINKSLDNLYFNSGVMFFDFKYKDEIPELDKMIDYIKNNKNDIIWHDQDILNHFFSGTCDQLEERYNYITTYKSLGDLFTKKGLKKASVVHYANWKPWKRNYIGKAYRLYLKWYKYSKKNYYPEMNFLKRRNIFSMFKLIMKYILR